MWILKNGGHRGEEGMIAKAVEILLQILRKEKTRGLPLKVVESMLEDQLVSEADNPTELTKQAID